MKRKMFPDAFLRLCVVIANGSIVLEGDTSCAAWARAEEAKSRGNLLSSGMLG